MSFLALSSIMALLIKLSLFWVGKASLFKDNQSLALFLVALCALNFSELMLFIFNDNEPILLVVIQAYYAAAVISAAALFNLSMHIIKRSGPFVAIVSILSLMIAMLTFIPGVIIGGVESIGYSVTRIPGEYFPILQTYLIMTLLCSSGILFFGAVKSDNRVINKRSLIMLISVTPLIFFTVTLTIALSFGFKFNGTVILSAMTSLMLIILIYSEKQYRLFKFLSYVPYTPEHELRTRAGKLVNQAIENLFDRNSNIELKDIRSEFETTLIQLAIESTGGNKTRAAKILGIGKATLHRKIGGLDL